MSQASKKNQADETGRLISLIAKRGDLYPKDTVLNGNLQLIKAFIEKNQAKYLEARESLRKAMNFLSDNYFLAKCKLLTGIISYQEPDGSSLNDKTSTSKLYFE